MTRHQEIRTELSALYTRSLHATSELVIREIEARISYLEGEAASLPH